MWRKRSLCWCFAFCYNLTLLFGLVPAPLIRHPTKGWQLLPKCRVYLWYSGVVHLACLLGLPVVFTYYYMGFEHEFNKTLVLDWSAMLINQMKGISMMLLIRDVWCKRHTYRQAFAKFEQLSGRLRRFRALSHRFEPLCERVSADTERFLLHKTLSHAVYIIVTVILIIVFMPYNNLWTYANMALSVQQNLMWMLPMALFSFVVCALQREFAIVNAALLCLKDDLRTNAASTSLSRHLKCLYSVHYELNTLTQWVFRIFGLPFGLVLLQWFTANVRVCLHLCYCLLGYLGSYRPVQCFGVLFWAVPLWWDSVMVVALIEFILLTANRSGRILRQFSDEPRIEQQRELAAVLDLFSVYTVNHRLHMTVCGLVEFNRSYAFAYAASMVLQVIVWVQFDLANPTKRMH